MYSRRGARNGRRIGNTQLAEVSRHRISRQSLRGCRRRQLNRGVSGSARWRPLRERNIQRDSVRRTYVAGRHRSRGRSLPGTRGSLARSGDPLMNGSHLDPSSVSCQRYAPNRNDKTEELTSPVSQTRGVPRKCQLIAFSSLLVLWLSLVTSGRAECSS